MSELGTFDNLTINKQLKSGDIFIIFMARFVNKLNAITVEAICTNCGKQKRTCDYFPCVCKLLTIHLCFVDIINILFMNILTLFNVGVCTCK